MLEIALASGEGDLTVTDTPLEQAVAALWEEASRDVVDVDATGRLVDYLDHAKRRPDTGEERVRQAFARVLHEDYGYPLAHMAFAAPLSIGSSQREADIAIYDSQSACLVRDQGRIVLIVETKAPDVASGKEQLASYIFATSAEGGVWTDGTTRNYFWRDQAERRLRDWTGIPRFGETWDAVGYYGKADLVPPRNLKQTFRRCHNAIYRRGLDSEDIAVDMMRLILAKYRDEQNPGEMCEFRCTPSEFETQEGRSACAQRIRQLFAQVVEQNPDVFQPHEEITAGDDAMAVVVQELQPFRFLADDDTPEVYDIIGTAFEVYVAAHLKGERGQYFTNRVVVKFLVDALEPTERDLILDPAAGSGGFLIAALGHIRHRIEQSKRFPAAKAKEMREASNRLFGVDISPKLVKIAKTNMILNGDGHSGCVRGNTLGDPADLPVAFRLRPGGQRPTLVLTNPPFGASHDLRVRDRETLQRFELGRVWQAGPDSWAVRTDIPNDAEGVPPEILFLERAISWLAPKGQLGIVMARGVLDNKDALPARQYVLRHTRLLGVVNCHPNTFRPFNGTKASLLLLEKKERPGLEHSEDYPVFMAISRKIGQDSKGHEIYRVAEDGTWVLRNGQKVLDEDMSEIAIAFHDFRVGRPITIGSAWAMPLSRILASAKMRFNPLRYAPVAEDALATVNGFSHRSGWHVVRLGDVVAEEVFNGPRFVRPFADEGITTGPSIVRLHTPKSVFEERAESAKYLDLAGASPLQLKQIDDLRLKAGWILIVDSGTAGKLMGKVGMTARAHEGTIGNNNLVRVIIEDPALRAYVYAFLRSGLGQRLLLRNTYGTNQDHIEPSDVADILLPVPDDVTRLSQLAQNVETTLRLREEAMDCDRRLQDQVDALLAPAPEQEAREA